MVNWEVFQRRAAPVVSQPFVTLQKRGTMSLNAAAFEALGEPEAVELLFDRGERLLGFRPVDPSAPHAYRPRKQGRTANYVVSGMALTQYYGVETDTARRYAAEMRDGVLVVDLKQSGSDATGVRAGSGKDRPRREAGVRDG